MPRINYPTTSRAHEPSNAGVSLSRIRTRLNDVQRKRLSSDHCTKSKSQLQDILNFQSKCIVRIETGSAHRKHLFTLRDVRAQPESHTHGNMKTLRVSWRLPHRLCRPACQIFGGLVTVCFPWGYPLDCRFVSRSFHAATQIPSYWAVFFWARHKDFRCSTSLRSVFIRAVELYSQIIKETTKRQPAVEVLQLLAHMEWLAVGSKGRRDL